MITKMILTIMMGQMKVKKKKIEYKRFQSFDKTSKKLTLDEETKNFFEQTENR